jgi:hypothetical protein
LSSIGFVELIRKRQKELLIIPILIFVQLTVISYVLEQPFTRYFYPLFAIILVVSSYGITLLADVLRKTTKKLSESFATILVTLVVLLILNLNNKLTIIPTTTYSLNSDMQEVPEVDWKQIFFFVDQKIKDDKGIVLVVNWSDLPFWYLKEGRVNFLLRNIKLERDSLSQAEVISGIDKLKQKIFENQKGIVVIDSWDNYLPEGINDYCKENLKREIEVDRLYPVQPRYWPVSLYSWGLD